MARILSRDELSAYLEHIRLGEGLHRAARKIGVDPRLVRQARKVNPEFDEMVKEAETEAAEPVESVLYSAALAGEPWAVQLWLKQRSSARWSPPATTVKVEHNLAPSLESIMELAKTLEARREMMGLGAGPGVIDAEAEPEDSSVNGQ